MRLDGRHAVVTGAASGIGLAIVRCFREAGATVSAVDLWQDRAAASALPQGAEQVPCDVADEAAVAEAARGIEARHGGVGVLVTAAGISVGMTAEETSLHLWRAVMETNATGTFLWVRACLPMMRRAGRGSIVTVASQRALAGGNASASYIASKGAVLSLTRNLAVDYAADGIRANALLPGAIETPMLEGSFTRVSDPDEARRKSIARHPMGRFGRPEEVASAALFLASDASSFVTGAYLPVDGGWLAG